MNAPTATEVATDDCLWSVYMRGWAEGLRCGYTDGYQAGAADEAADEAAEWARHRERVDAAARDVGLRERRGGDPHAVASERARRGWTP